MREPFPVWVLVMMQNASERPFTFVAVGTREWWAWVDLEKQGLATRQPPTPPPPPFGRDVFSLTHAGLNRIHRDTP
jgi:hypothetical protein